MELIAKAARVATHAHRLQYRKYPNSMGVLDPYIVHPARVASAVFIYQDELPWRMKDSIEILVAAAWLHDVIEDTPLELFYLQQMFPQEVTRIVVGLTKQFAYGEQVYTHLEQGGPLSAMVVSAPRAEKRSREAAYYGRQGESVKVLKALDRIDNLSDILVSGDSFASKYAEESKELLAAIRTEIPTVLTRKIEFLIAEIGRAVDSSKPCSTVKV